MEKLEEESKWKCDKNEGEKVRQVTFKGNVWRGEAKEKENMEEGEVSVSESSSV